jgi:hypothetical protein
MPHLVLAGEIDLRQAVDIAREVHRWGRAVLKTEQCWLHTGGEALLVEGVVVEFERPLHPVALVARNHGNTVVRLWSRVAVERTRPVQRWLAIVALELQRLGAGPVKTTNIPDELWSDLGLEAAR